VAFEQINAFYKKKIFHFFFATPQKHDSLLDVKTEIMKWYNAYMDRVTGWYKKKVKDELFWIALCMAIFMNIDVFRLASGIWNDRGLQAVLIAQAEKAVSDSSYVDSQICDDLTPEARIKCIKEKYNELKLTDLPIGWISETKDVQSTDALQEVAFWKPDFWSGVKNLIQVNAKKYLSFWTIIGWLLTAFVLRQGAPFWFEALSKVVNLRGSGTRPAASTQPDKQHKP
jgi:hypothetical protein